MNPYAKDTARTEMPAPSYDWTWPSAYCSIANSRCPYPSPPNPADRAGFIAYSSEPRIADDMRRFAQRQDVIGASLVPWEAIRRAGASVIFCDICKELFQASAAIFEITDLNQNVLFELGYALGKGRRCVLLRNTRIQPQRLQLVTDVRYLPYETTEDIVAKLGRRDPFTEESLGQVLLAACSESRIIGDFCSILYLQTGSRSDAGLLVHRTLKKLKRARTLAENPRESFSHQLFELARRLAAADIVVAMLDTKVAVGAQERNAQTCILAGMAVALHKRVLILQEQPADHLIDLKAIMREYRTGSEARAIATGLQSIVDAVIDSRQVPKKAQAVAAISSVRPRGIAALDFGQPAAEQEADDLHSYFLRTAAFRAARTGSRWLFVGRRGTGKSANCLELARDLSHNRRNVVSVVCPLEVELRGVKAALEEHFEENAQPYIFESVWSYLLYTEIARAVVGHMDEQPPFWDAAAIKTLADWQSHHPGDLDCELDERLHEALRVASAGVSEETHWAPDGAKVERLYRTRASELAGMLHTILADRTVYLLIDNLDKDWDDSDPTSARLLVGLLRATERIVTSAFRRNARIIIFLREDIQRALKGYDEDAEKRTWMDLKWDPQLLLSLVSERIRQSINPPAEMSDENLWSLCFDESVDGTGSCDYVFERTLLRPRHAIWYCNRALNIARRRGHEKIQAEDIKKAERDYSEQVLTNFAREFPHPRWDLYGLALQFCDAPAELDELQVRLRVRKWCDESREGGSSSADEGVQDAISFLYDVGLLGVVQANGERDYGHTEPSYQRAIAGAKLVLPSDHLSLASRFIRRLGAIYRPLHTALVRRQSVPVYCIHPAFWRTLDVQV